MKLVVIVALSFGACLSAQDINKPRVFVGPSDSWEGRRGAAPQTAEVFKTFGQRCSTVIMTNNKERADFMVTLDHEGGKAIARRDSKIVVFNKLGDMVYSGSARSVGGAVKGACTAIGR